MFMAHVKFVLVAVLLGAGILLLVRATGLAIPFHTHTSVDAHGLSVGISLLVVGVMLSVGWKAGESEYRGETRQDRIARRGHDSANTHDRKD
jgi:hypothetical protein